MAVGGHSFFAKSNCKIEPPNLQPNFTGNSFVEPDFNLWKIVDSLVCPTTISARSFTGDKILELVLVSFCKKGMTTYREWR